MLPHSHSTIEKQEESGDKEFEQEVCQISLYLIVNCLAELVKCHTQMTPYWSLLSAAA